MSTKPTFGILLLIVSLAFVAAGSDWCPDGCCTTDGQAGFCEVEKICPHELNECAQELPADNDCCQELQHAEDQLALVSWSDDFQIHYYSERSESQHINISITPNRHIQFLTPWPVGPPWIDVKHHTELLI